MSVTDAPQGSAGTPLLSIRDLEVTFRTESGSATAVRGVSFDVHAGQTVAVVGESGSGKSTTAAAVIGLLAANGSVTAGQILFEGEDLAALGPDAMRRLRGSRIGMVPQDPMSNLNPVRRVGAQVDETLQDTGVVRGRRARARTIELLAEAGLPDAERRAQQYPHEFSGGMRQRALIAMGLAARPHLLIADEPTSALDVTVQRTILDGLTDLTDRLGVAVLLITHDLGLAAERADRVVVMYRGEVVEEGDARSILTEPRHEYTRRLLAAAPSLASRRIELARHGVEVGGTPEQDLLVAPAPATGSTPATATAPRRPAEPQDAVRPLVEVDHVTKVFTIRGRGLLGRSADFTAVDEVSLAVPRGRTLAVVGESGSGKSTVARMMLGLLEPTSGSIRFDGADVVQRDRSGEVAFRRRVQPIFQDPYASLDPLFTVYRTVEEPLRAHRIGDRASRHARVRELMEQVALPAGLLRRYPAELSGGQRQRVAIARALALEPELVVCDEAVSALDVIVQSQILRLLAELQERLGLTYLFISHDLAVVRQVADEVCVMQEGRVVERGTVDDVFDAPRTTYTRTLLDAIPGRDLDLGRPA
ncbi:dipeptide ABC transporter ATP-binding protein [Cellulomonas xiejunii]|uniref:ABC transporter ATP-binding protein n=1 Tax=Cellulomonas xiejunii TaxID=2968083 RepID=A0ABY5KJZ2_9CELL|nr:ABC transporter ATP-binding protein [Cellulomonas xiejunii]MCC2319823.1 ABC transporter ATP-binding protein [Cellulomonas xiejunii]UUI70155.1 ABC transporter ATP-binding protein [Cellulomonas xiejunii]